MFISAFLPKQSNLSFRRLYAHSMTIRADESLNPKNCSFSLDPPFRNSFIKKSNKGFAGSSKVHTGTGSSPFNYNFRVARNIFISMALI